jgi:anti-anti-sigma factor
MMTSFEPSDAKEGALLARIEGTLDANAAVELWEEMAAQVNETTRFVVFDFSGVKILTSAGIGTLVRLFTRLRGYGGGLAVFGCTSKVCEIFDVVMLRDILGVSETELEAWNRLPG